jgi:hypothetical protein
MQISLGNLPRFRYVQLQKKERKGLKPAKQIEKPI